MTKFVDPNYEGHSKVNYTVDEKNGEIKVEQVQGWEAEYESTERAWEEIRAELVQCRAEVAAGRASPLLYYMKKRMMDSALLAAEAKLCHFFVRRHLKSPRAWRNLRRATKIKYATALNFPVEQLDELPKEDHGN